MAKSKPSDANLASFCWRHDTSTVDRILEAAQEKLDELGHPATDAPVFPRPERPLGNFNEASWRDWIESIQLGDDQHIAVLQSLVTTCRIRLGHETESPTSATVDTDIELVERRDSGLYGVIWEGRQSALNRKVAVKIIRPSMVNIASAIEHAHALARLQHENVVTVHQLAKVRDPESDEVVDGVVMEWLEGKTLADRLLTPCFLVKEARDICISLLQGITHIHSKELTHGDLHPRNVIITDNAIKIIDINYTESHSLAVLSSTSRATQIQFDIDSLRFLIRRVVYHSQIDAQIIGDYIDQLPCAKTIDDIRIIVDELFHQVEYGRSGELKIEVKSDVLTPLEKLCALGLEISDALALKFAGEKVLAGQHNTEVLSSPALADDLRAEGLTFENVSDSLELLYKKGFIKSQGRHSRFFQLSASGFDAYLRCFYESYTNDFDRICSAIVIDGSTNDIEIMQSLELPRPIVLHVLDMLNIDARCEIIRTNAGTSIAHVSVDLRRRFEKKLTS